MGGRIQCSNTLDLWICCWKRLFPPHEVHWGHSTQTGDIQRVSGSKHITKVSWVGGELSEKPSNGLQGHTERRLSVTLCQTSPDLKCKLKPSFGSLKQNRPTSAPLNGCFDWIKPFLQTLFFLLLLRLLLFRGCWMKGCGTQCSHKRNSARGRCQETGAPARQTVT